MSRPVLSLLGSLARVSVGCYSTFALDPQSLPPYGKLLDRRRAPGTRRSRRRCPTRQGPKTAYVERL